MQKDPSAKSFLAPGIGPIWEEYEERKVPISLSAERYHAHPGGL